MQCEERKDLKALARSDLTAYGDAVVALQRHSIDALSALDELGDFEKAQKLAERAMLAYQVSRQKLEKHIAGHGCLR